MALAYDARGPGLKSRATRTKPARSRLDAPNSPPGLRLGSRRLEPPDRSARSTELFTHSVGLNTAIAWRQAFSPDRGGIHEPRVKPLARLVASRLAREPV